MLDKPRTLRYSTAQNICISYVRTSKTPTNKWIHANVQRKSETWEGHRSGDYGGGVGGNLRATEASSSCQVQASTGQGNLWAGASTAPPQSQSTSSTGIQIKSPFSAFHSALYHLQITHSPHTVKVESPSCFPRVIYTLLSNSSQIFNPVLALLRSSLTLVFRPCFSS